MKKFGLKILSLIFVVGLCPATLQAQCLTNYDTYKFGQQDLNGTARFVAVGGAMGALGGDATTIFYNPAGIGIYRSSEITASLNVHWDNATLSTDNYKGPTERRVSANLENIAYVGHWDFGYSENKEYGLSFGVAYNRMKNFDRNGRYGITKNYSKTQFLAGDAYGQSPEALLDEKGRFSNPNIGYRAILGFSTFMFDPTVDSEGKWDNGYISYYDKNCQGQFISSEATFSESGHADEFAVSFAGNIKNIFYLGMSFICNYTSYSRIDKYYEYFNDNRQLSTLSKFDESGTAFTYKVGFILRPTSWLRIGGAYHTPSYYNVRSSNYSEASSNLDLQKAPADAYGSIYTPTNSERAYINAPMKAIGSLGFVLGKYGFIGLEYQWNNESGAVLNDNTKFNNQAIANKYKTEVVDTHTARIGVEIKPIDAFSVRLGGGYRTAANKSDASRWYYTADTRTDVSYTNDKGSYYVTAGLGYRLGRHSIDLAYMWHVTNYNYFEFGGAVPMNLRDVNNQFLISYAVRF